VEEKGKWCHNGKRAAAARTYLRWGREGGTQGGGLHCKEDAVRIE